MGEAVDRLIALAGPSRVQGHTRTSKDGKTYRVKGYVRNSGVEGAVASVLHNNWREARKQADGSYEPRMKDDGKGGKVDIANTDYHSLPEQWQRENLESARSALKAAQAAGPKADVETVAEAVHIAWLERNSEWAEEIQKLPYADLPEDEKEKDRVVARAAIEALKKGA